MGNNDLLFQLVALVISGSAIGVGVGITWGAFLALNNAWHFLVIWNGKRTNRRQCTRHLR